jgi:intracellular septation protein
MKLLFDFFPILLFFAAYKLYDIYVATATAIVATIVQVSLFWLKHRRVEKMHLVTLALIAILGGATLYLKDPAFIKWKPTIAYWLFACAFLGSQYIGERSLAERMMGHAITAPKPVWSRLTLAWALFFISMGFINLYVAFNFSEETWVNFKLFGLMGLTITFVVVQGFFLARYMDAENGDEKEI